MIVNLVTSNLIPSGYAAGTGLVRQEADGTFTAIAVLGGDLGIYARGADEGTALKALEAKIKGVGLICTTAHAEAEAPYRMKRNAEDKKQADQMLDMLKEALGGGPKDPLRGLPGPKSKTPSEN